MSTATISRASSSQDFAQAFQNSYWVKSPGFDLSFVTGGAFFTLAIAALAFAQPTLLPVFFWMWIVLFEGSHFWATFSRTYIDPKFSSENKAVLFGSLVFFAFPAAAVYLDIQQSQISYTTIYGFFIFVWSLYHNARQHYGFLSIYAGKAKLGEIAKSRMVNTLYFSICTAQVYFLLNFKLQGAFGIPAFAEMNPSLGFLTAKLPILLSGAIFVYFFYLTGAALRQIGPRVFASVFYIFVCLVFYSTMFYVIAPADSFVQNLSGGETLMLIAIMNSLFHNIQYHAIVWHYGQKRYAEAGVDKQQYGFAHFVNGKTINYMAFALLLGSVFGFIVWNVGDWPSFSGSWESVAASKWAYILFFGIIGHHFYLDQKIWRPSKSKELKTYLGLSNSKSS